MSNTTTSTVVTCQARAYDFLVRLMGVRPDDLTWDSTHRLQGHVHFGGHELVVIATRDADAPAGRADRSTDGTPSAARADNRHELIQSYAITDHSGLVAAIRSTSPVALAGTRYGNLRLDAQRHARRPGTAGGSPGPVRHGAHQLVKQARADRDKDRVTFFQSLKRPSVALWAALVAADARRGARDPRP